MHERINARKFLAFETGVAYGFLEFVTPSQSHAIRIAIQQFQDRVSVPGRGKLDPLERPVVEREDQILRQDVAVVILPQMRDVLVVKRDVDQGSAVGEVLDRNMDAVDFVEDLHPTAWTVCYLQFLGFFAVIFERREYTVSFRVTHQYIHVIVPGHHAVVSVRSQQGPTDREICYVQNRC